MTARNIWTEYHLTPKGWIAGTRNHEFLSERDRPSDAVRTVKVRDFQSVHLGFQHTRHITWQAPNSEELVKMLMMMFGDAPDIA